MDLYIAAFRTFIWLASNENNKDRKEYWLKRAREVYNRDLHLKILEHERKINEIDEFLRAA